MNKDMMKRNVGVHVLLQPPAIYLDENGLEAKQPTEPERWRVEDVTDEGVKISNLRSRHYRVLGYDHIKNFASDGVVAGTRRGFLILVMQPYIQGNDVTLVPTRTPGEPVHPPPPVNRLVDSNYPTVSGIQQRLVSQGYGIRWCKPERVGSLEAQGWRLVAERDTHGVLSTFRRADGQVLVKVRILPTG